MPEGQVFAPEQSDKRTRNLVMALLAIGALLLLIAVGTATRAILSISDNTDLVEHSLEVEAEINRLSAQAERMETARRGFLIEPSPAFEVTVRDAGADADQTMARLASLIADNPVQVERMRRIRSLSDVRKSVSAELFADPAAALAKVRGKNFNTDRGVLAMRQMRAILAQMLSDEQGLLSQRNENQLDSLVTFYLTGGLAFGLLLIFMIGAIAVVTRYNRDLAVAQSRLRVVNEGLEDAVQARTTELTRANEEIQRFAYIVSHDLRSPLVNVLGFTSELDQARRTLRDFVTRLFDEHPELRDEAAVQAVEEDLPEALGFIRGSTEKMDRLINSILELSRQGRRKLHPERLDMTALADSVADSLRQRADAAGAAMTVDPIPALVSDRIAVEQILSNLAENALKYLDPARPGEVKLAGERKGREIEISVTDNGRGIAPVDHERIFDLFRRAGTQDQAGEGIGLANVRALAYRLGGRVSVESQLGEGARFILTLPEKFSVAE